MPWHPMSGRKSLQGRLSDKLGSLLTFFGTAIAWPFYRLLDLALWRRQKYYDKLSRHCVTACFVECWTLIFEKKPIDSTSPIFEGIFNSINHFTRTASEQRGDFNAFEHTLLRSRFITWVLRDSPKPDDTSAIAFASEHNLNPTIEKYVNLHNYVAFIAAQEIRPLEELAKERPSAEYWKGTVWFKDLPDPLNETTKPRSVGKFLRANVVRLQSELAQSNYIKIDFSFSDLSTLLALLGTLLVVLGYTRVFILGKYFGFPFQEYFGVSDYLSRSLNITGQVLFSAMLTAAFGFTYLSSANAYSLTQEDLRRKSVPGRIDSITWHIVGLSSLPALAFHYYMAGVVDPLLALAGMIYVGSFVVGRMSARYFENPLKAFLLVSLIFLSFVNTISGVILEINSLNRPSETSPRRIVKFSDAEYQETDWQFIAFTSDYVIMRNRQTQQVLVRARSDLKVVESNAAGAKASSPAGPIP